MAGRKTNLQRARDRHIEQVYYKHGSGVEINIFDIPKIFERGHAALDAGEDLDAAIQKAIADFRQN